MHTTDGRVIVFPRCPLVLLFQCVTVRSSFTLPLVKLGQKTRLREHRKGSRFVRFAHETPKARFQRGGNPAETSHHLIDLRPPYSRRVDKSLHGLPKLQTLHGCNLSVSSRELLTTLGQQATLQFAVAPLKESRSHVYLVHMRVCTRKQPQEDNGHSAVMACRSTASTHV